MTPALHLVLEFARAEAAGQPHGFRFAPQTYLLRNPGGDFAAAELPWTRELLADLRALRGGVPDPDVAHRIGAVLHQFLAASAWPAHEPAIVRATRTGVPVVITIRSAAAELYALPWELLTLRETGQQLGGLPGLLVRHEWPATTSAPDSVAPAARTGRALFAWSAAGGSVPAADHLAALRAHVPGFDPARDVLAHAGFAALADTLERAARDGPPIDVLHLLGHGAAIGTTYGLALDDPAGGPALVDAGRLQQLLAPHAGMLRAVVVAACDSGNVGEPGNHLGSVAQMIHRAGVRAVVASRFPLSVAGSTRFTAAFYADLAAPASTLEHAFIAGRDALVRDPSQLDWASVQLYARAADGDATRPFARPADEPAPPALAAPPPPVAPRPRLAPRIAAAVTIAAALALALVRPWQTPQTSWARPPAIPTPAPIAAEPAPARPAPIVPPEPAPPTLTEPSIVAPLEPPIVAPEATPKTPKTTPKPTCGRDRGACKPAIRDHIYSRVTVPARLAVKVDCDGRITYRVKPADAEAHADAADVARRKLPALGDRSLVAADSLPCTLDYDPNKR